MIYGMPILQYGLPCVELCEGDEPFPVEAVCPVIDGLAGEDMVIDSGVIREKTADEKAAYQTAIAASLTQQDDEWQQELKRKILP